MRKVYKKAATRVTIFSDIFTFFSVYYLAYNFAKDDAIGDMMIVFEILLVALHTGCYFSGLRTELRYLEGYMIMSNSLTGQKEVDFNDFDETYNNSRTTCNILNAIIGCACFGIYVFHTLKDCAWWMIFIIVIEALVFMLLYGVTFSLYKECSRSFKSINKKFESGEYK